MKYEDLSVPIHLLHKGVDKLLSYGMPTFELFADEVGMGHCDRNRVIGKCRILAPDKKLMELACPPKLKGERWNYYTKKLGYSDDHARDLLKRVDESYENQFIPPNPATIARDIF